MTHRWIIIMLCMALVSPPLHAKPRRPSPDQRLSTDYSLSEGDEVKIKSRKANLPAFVYGDESGKKDLFVASGVMGDAEAFKKVTSSFDASAPASLGHTGKTSLKVRYLAKGRKGWGGIYWLTPANNWGQIKGAGFDLSKANRLTFWIRGAQGGEKISEVKVGGISGPYPDSDSASIGPLVLTKDWEQYSIPLEGRDMRHIVGGFAFIVRRADNPNGATFFLDEIVFRGEGEDPSLDVKYTSPPDDVLKKFQTKEKAVVPEPILVNPVRRVILFSTAKKSIGAKEQDILADIIEVASKYENTEVRVEGHTDNIGPAELNKSLSRQRAKIVYDYLLKKGIPENRIDYVGLGEEQPAATNNTQDGRYQNRRVEVIVNPL